MVDILARISAFNSVFGDLPFPRARAPLGRDGTWLPGIINPISAILCHFKDRASSLSGIMQKI